jgi:hypothetical protein
MARPDHSPVAFSGTALCKVDAGYGGIEVGNLLVAATRCAAIIPCPELSWPKRWNRWRPEPASFAY